MLDADFKIDATLMEKTRSLGTLPSYSVRLKDPPLPGTRTFLFGLPGRWIIVFLITFSSLFIVLKPFFSWTLVQITENFALPITLPWIIVVDTTCSLPSTFPSSGNVLWYRTPAKAWSKDYLPIGNGYLGAMVSGGTGLDQMQLNLESLWYGGPYKNAVGVLNLESCSKRSQPS